MKRLLGERRQASGFQPDGPLFKERRKAYYHGKYTKQMFSVLVIATCVAIIFLKQAV
jgi:hypothetical protein